MMENKTVFSVHFREVKQRQEIEMFVSVMQPALMLLKAQRIHALEIRREGIIMVPVM